MPTSYTANIDIDGTELGERLGFVFAPVATSEADRVYRAARYFETSVKTILGELRLRQSGQAVLDAVTRSARRVRIVPYFGGSKDNPNATAAPTHGQAARKRGWRPRSGEGVLTGTARGTGQGSDAVVEFFPPDFARRVPGVEVGVGPGAFGDEVLLHELVHALRYLRGVTARRPVRFQRTFAYGNREEFYAILVANIYRSECGRLGLRHDHKAFAPMAVSATDFLKLGQNRAYLRQLRREVPDLFRALRGVRASFNPTAFIG